MTKLPILIVIPHGGYKVPEEFAEHTEIEEADLLLSADTGANELFSSDTYAAILNTHISRLFIDLDRSPMELPPRASDGVMKPAGFFGGDLFSEGQQPDNIALANVLRRYYFPFHDALRKIISSSEVRFVLECHTVAAVGGYYAADRDRPRPIVSIQNLVQKGERTIEGAAVSAAEHFLSQFRKCFSGEDCVSEKPFIISDKPVHGHIAREYAGTIPWLRINLSRGLFLNDNHFNFDYGKIDQIRIGDLRRKVEDAVVRGLSKI
jgi:N-formylglutamate deformylase